MKHWLLVAAIAVLCYVLDAVNVVHLLWREHRFRTTGLSTTHLSGKPVLSPVPVFGETNLTHAAFIRDFVDARRPVVIRLKNPQQIDLEFLNRTCGDNAVPLLSPATQSVLDSLPSVVKSGFSLLLQVCGVNIDVAAEIDRRAQTRVGEYLSFLQEHTRSSVQPQKHEHPTLLKLLPAVISLGFDILGRPRYLHDLPVHSVCPQLLENWKVPKYLAVNWLSFFPFDVVREQLLNNPYIFIGPGSSMSYPLHQNIFRADVMLQQVKGSKKSVLFDPATQHEYLRPWKQGNAQLYRASGFGSNLISAPLAGLAQGWEHTLQPGDMLYMPGHWIHQFENTGAVSVALKYWFGGAATLCGPSDDACHRDLKTAMSRHEKNVGARFEDQPKQSLQYSQYAKMHSHLKFPITALTDRARMLGGK